MPKVLMLPQSNQVYFTAYGGTSSESRCRSGAGRVLVRRRSVASNFKKSFFWQVVEFSLQLYLLRFFVLPVPSSAFDISPKLKSKLNLWSMS